MIGLAVTFFDDAIESLSWSDMVRESEGALQRRPWIDIGELPSDMAEAIRPLIAARRRVTPKELNHCSLEASAALMGSARNTPAPSALRSSEKWSLSRAGGRQRISDRSARGARRSLN